MPQIAAVAVSDGVTVRAQWRVVERIDHRVVETPDGAEEYEVPIYGAVVAESERLPRSAWPVGMKVTEFVTSVLGPWSGEVP